MAGSLKKYGIGKEDFALHTDETYPDSTFNRLGSMGGTQAITYAPNLWLTHRTVINARYYNSGALTQATINAAIAAAGSNDKIIYLDEGTWVLSANVTGTSNIFFEFAPGAIIQPASGVTLTVYSPEHILASPRQQIVDATNNSTNPLAFTEPGIIYGNWWDGDISDGTTVADTLFGMAVTGAAAGSEIIVLPAVSYYNFTDELTISKRIHFHGTERDAADIRQATSAKSAIILSQAATGAEVDHLKLTGPQYATEQSGEQAIRIEGTDKDTPITNISVHDLNIQEWGYSGIVMGSWVEDFTIDNNYIKNVYKHGIITRSASRGEITRNHVFNVLADSSVGSTGYGIILTTSNQDNAAYPPSSYITVDENYVNNIIDEGISNHYGSDNKIVNNHISATVDGIIVQGSALGNVPDNAVVAHNTIVRGSTWTVNEVGVGIYVAGSADGTLAGGCDIHGNTVDGYGRQNATLGTTPSAAFETRLLDTPTIYGNKILNSGRIGMHYRSIVDLHAYGNTIDTVSGTGPVKATGTITFADNPSINDTITINGAEYTFVAAAATDYQITIAGSLPLTLDNTIAVLNAATTPINSYSTDGRVSTATYTEDGTDTLTITYDYPGRNGNYFTLAASADTVSGANLTGGEVGSSAIVIEKLSGMSDNTGKISNEIIDVSSSYAAIVTEPDTDIVGLYFDDIKIANAGCRFDLGGSGRAAPNEATRHIDPLSRISFSYDLPSIAQDASYTFYVPMDGNKLYTHHKIINNRSDLGLVYNSIGQNNNIKVVVWNFSGGAINAGSQTINIISSLLYE